MSRGTTGFVCLLVGVVGGWAQVPVQPRIAPSARRAALPNLRVNTNLVLVPISVTDASNRPVLGLNKSSFRIFDNNVEQQVESLVFEDAPVGIAVVFDTSGSMDRKMPKSRVALGRLLETANPEDEFCLIEFSDEARLARSWTSDPAEITRSLAGTAPRGRTALLDAIALALRELKKSAKPRKAIVILSDGGDNRSRLTERELRSMARESDALIYAMGIFEGIGIQLSLEELAGPGLLEEITEASGGRLFPVSDVNHLPEIAARIGVELHNQYVVAYSPSATQHDGRHHRLRVEVLPPAGNSSLNVDWRAGYRAPIQ
jgi:Ca-activated chloride channel family protein